MDESEKEHTGIPRHLQEWPFLVLSHAKKWLTNIQGQGAPQFTEFVLITKLNKLHGDYWRLATIVRWGNIKHHMTGCTTTLHSNLTWPWPEHANASAAASRPARSETRPAPASAANFRWRRTKRTPPMHLTSSQKDWDAKPDVQKWKAIRISSHRSGENTKTLSGHLKIPTEMPKPTVLPSWILLGSSCLALNTQSKQYPLVI